MAWIVVALMVVLAVVAWQVFGLGRYLTLDALKAGRDGFVAAYAAQPLRTALLFGAVYVVSTALSIPGATVLTLAAGAIFGFPVGLAVAITGATLGALLAFLAARYLLRDALLARWGERLAGIDEGLRRDGSAYLLTLRLVPIFPFWLVNLLMGLTPMGAARYTLLSLVGMLPATAVFIQAGTQLAAIRSPSDVLSPALVGSLALLGLFPWLAKAAVAAWRRRRQAAGWPRPRRFDRNLVVIGAGAGGLVSAYVAAAARASVTLVEAGRMGGDCLNTGCVPSKALIRSARAAAQLRRSASLGLVGAPAEVDFAAVMQRVRGVVRAVEPHDSVERYTGLGVEVLQGRAQLVGPWTVEVALHDGSSRRLNTRSIIVATGAEPLIPPLPGLRPETCLTSETLWSLEALPRRLVVLGGGAVGCEMAQAFARLGSQVSLIEAAPRLLPREEPQAAELLADALRADGVTLHLGVRARRVDASGPDGRCLVLDDGHGADGLRLPHDALLVAVGRRPRVGGFGLEALGIELTPQQAIRTDAALRTRWPHILAVGDVTGVLQLTHMAGHQAWTAAVNALFGRWWRFRVDERVIPRVVFTEPELARVGLTEDEARQRGVAFEVTRVDLAELDRAIADGATGGFVQVLTPPGRDRILGVTVVGEHAGELIAEWALAMRHGLGLGGVLGTVHAYPTWGEANRAVAGAWRRAHAPQRLLRWVERYHRWQRG